jgi:hypothetical protein
MRYQSTPKRYRLWVQQFLASENQDKSALMIDATDAA